MRSALKGIGALAVLLVAVGIGWLLAATGVGRAADVASLTDLERTFAERMQNVALEGHFTIEGREQPGALRDLQGHKAGRRPVAFRRPPDVWQC